MLLLLLACSVPCSSGPRLTLDGLPADSQDRLERVVRGFLQRTGPTCVDEVVVSPVAHDLGESWRTEDGWKVVMPPDASDDTVYRHLCKAVLLETRPLLTAPADLALDAGGFYDVCRQGPPPLSYGSTCVAEPDDLQRYARDDLFGNHPWEQGPVASLTRQAPVWVPESTYGDPTLLGTFADERGWVYARAEGADLVLETLGTDGSRTREVLAGRAEDVGYPVAGNVDRIVSRVADNTLVILDRHDGDRSELSVTSVDGDPYSLYGRLAELTEHALVISSSTWPGAPLTVVDLRDGRLRKVSAPASDYAPYLSTVSQAWVDPGRPDRVVVQWFLYYEEAVLIDVSQGFLADTYIGTLDLETDAWSTVLHVDSERGDPYLRGAGMLSTGELLLYGDGAYGLELDTGVLRAFDGWCPDQGGSIWTVAGQPVTTDYGDRNGEPGFTWTPYALSP